MKNLTDYLWEEKKQKLLESIDTVLEKSKNKEILEIMVELINNTKVVNTMEEFFEDKRY
ncbi:MAG TPA: hypothetical protein VI911_08245 [Patescibacteria group bacterium]|nr:hypothetical protein [Patescibacteria group bacterium]